jgi:hypothetical protein
LRSKGILRNLLDIVAGRSKGILTIRAKGYIQDSPDSIEDYGIKHKIAGIYLADRSQDFGVEDIFRFWVETPGLIVSGGKDEPVI